MTANVKNSYKTERDKNANCHKTHRIKGILLQNATEVSEVMLKRNIKQVIWWNKKVEKTESNKNACKRMTASKNEDEKKSVA